MAKMDDRLQMIGSAILLQAEEESRALIAKANRIREKQINEYEDEVIQTMFGDLQKQCVEVRIESVKRVATEQVKCQEQLLRRREELARSVFERARARLAEYSKTAEYRNSLPEDFSSAARAEMLRDCGPFTVYLRPDDMALASDIEKALPGCSAQSDATIKLGGWRLVSPSGGFLIDETLDTRLADQWPWFLKHSGLTLE